jgi:hypothetical protein
MSEANIKNKYKLVKVLVGAALILFGLFMLSQLITSDVIRIKAVLIGVAGLILGGFLLFRPYDTACSQCDKFLQTLQVHLDPNSVNDIMSAIKAGSAEKIAAHLESSSIPPAAKVGETRALMVYEICDECKSVGQFRVVETTYGQDQSSTTEKEVMAWQPIQDAAIDRIIEVTTARNLKQTADQYAPPSY